jgi:hypothetical protein
MICQNCGKEIETKNKKQKFCSHSCSAKYHNSKNIFKRKRVQESLKNNQKLKDFKTQWWNDHRKNVHKGFMMNMWVEKRETLLEKIKNFYKKNLNFASWRAKNKINQTKKIENFQKSMIEKRKFDYDLINKYDFRKICKNYNLFFKERFPVFTNNRHIIIPFYLIDLNLLVWVPKNRLFIKNKKSKEKEKLENMNIDSREEMDDIWQIWEWVNSNNFFYNFLILYKVPKTYQNFQEIFQYSTLPREVEIEYSSSDISNILENKKPIEFIEKYNKRFSKTTISDLDALRWGALPLLK